MSQNKALSPVLVHLLLVQCHWLGREPEAARNLSVVLSSAYTTEVSEQRLNY